MKFITTITNYIMTKVINFKNIISQGYYEEVKITEDVFQTIPSFFQNELDGNAELALVDPFGMLYQDGDFQKKPYYYFRHALIDQYRFGGIVELGNDYKSTQMKGETKGLFQQGDGIDKYKKRLSNNNEEYCYGFGTDEPFSEFRLFRDHQTWKEGDILDIKASYISNAIVDHQASFENLPQVLFPVLLEGTYHNQEVKGLGFFATNYKPKLQKASILESLGYITMMLSGIREDGRFEHAFISIDQSGIAGAYYKIDGEDIISSKEVSIETVWEHLPYVDDGTCVYKNAIFRFGGKEVHFEGKWGTKGVKEKPYLEKHGQSQILGTWYEGAVSYKHKVSFTFGENMEAFDYKLKSLGFEVI